MIKRIAIAAMLLLGVGSVAAQDNIGVYTYPLSYKYMERKKEIAKHQDNRGMANLDNAVVPKGQWVIGLTGSYSAHVNENYTFTLIEGIESTGYSIDVSPMVSYAFSDNAVAGVRFEYGRSLLDIDSARLEFGDDISIKVNSFHTIQSSYTFMAVARQYIPLGDAKRFALFAEGSLYGGFSRCKFANDTPVTGTFTKGYSVGVGIVPGIVAFATNDVAFEVSVGMLGLSYSKSEQVHNQVDEGETSTTFFNFKINLLSIGLGVAFYL